MINETLPSSITLRNVIAIKSFQFPHRYHMYQETDSTLLQHKTQTCLETAPTLEPELRKRQSNCKTVAWNGSRIKLSREWGADKTVPGVGAG